MKKSDVDILVKSNLYLSGYIIYKGLTADFRKFCSDNPNPNSLKTLIQSKGE